MPTYAQLVGILKANEIRGYSHYTKSKRVDLLDERGLVPEKYDIIIQDISKKDIDPKYFFLRQIRSNPRKVQIHDLEADEVAIYPSIYRAALVLGQNPGVIGMYNGKVWRNRYAIKVLTESD